MAGIYIHIPYCHSKCAYCDFYSLPRLDTLPRLAEALCAEYQLRKDEIQESSTIYLGGGTPSILPIECLRRISSCLNWNHVSESTLEANPEDVTYEKACAWHDLGFNRISMGVQSMVDAELAIIGRRHDANQTAQAVENIKRAGFENFSLDLIYGLPHQTLSSLAHTIEHILAMEPKHISAYSLTFEPRTRLSAMLRKGEIAEATEEETIAFYDFICKRLAEAGFLHYEISNFALPGFEAQHNSNYWRDVPYLGLGPSAHSFDGATRRINPSNIHCYLQAIEAGRPAYEIDTEDDDNRFNDKIITSLRTAKGLCLDQVQDSRLESLLQDAAPYLKTGDLILNNNHLRIPESSWLISDSILTALIQI